MDSSNAPFCNLYNRKCDFSPSRAAWHPDFFVMGLCSPFALRYAGRLQARLARRNPGVCYTARCAARLSAGAMLAGPRACLRTACHAGAFPGRRSGASMRLLVWLGNFGRDLPRLPYAKLSMWTTAMDLTRHWRPGMAPTDAAR